MNGLPLTDEYRFECTLCGECCRGDMDVFLNLYDLYKISRYFGLQNTKGLFDKGYVELKSAQHGMPMPKIRFRKTMLSFCPFLVNELSAKEELIGRCNLHPEHKPLICSRSPVGCEIDLANGKYAYQLVEPALECPGMEKPKKNRLSAMHRSYAKELKYEDRFYRILEHLKTNSIESSRIKKQLYYFTVDPPFENIINTLEKRFTVQASGQL